MIFFIKNTAVIALVLMHISIQAQKKLITIPFTYIQPYCGGARPSPEMVAEALVPKLYSNYSIIIVSSKGKIDSSKTNEKGVLIKKLKPGAYKLIEAWRYYKKAPQNLPLSYFDINCLKTEWTKEIKEVTITKKEIKVISKNDIYFDCEWKLSCMLEEHKHMPQ